MAMGRSEITVLEKAIIKCSHKYYSIFFFVKVYCKEVGYQRDTWFLSPRNYFFLIRKPSLFYEVPSNSTARPFDQVS